MNKTFVVSYTLLTESRTDTFLGSSRSDLSNLKDYVQAQNVGQARSIVESKFGGPSRVVILSVFEA